MRNWKGKLVQILAITGAAMLGWTPIDSNTGETPSEVREVVSHAYDVKTGQYIYSEHHREFYEKGKHVYSIVEYKTPQRVLAGKTINFSGSRTAPDFKLEDVRSGYIEGSQSVPGGFKLFARKDKDNPIKERVVPIPSPAVIDGGFDYFVRENFERLAAGERMLVNFGSSYQQDFFRFDIYKTGGGTFKGKDAVFLNVEVHNVLLKTLVDPIRLVYDNKTRRLLSYTGVSNVNDDNGKSYRARIEFQF